MYAADDGAPTDPSAPDGLASSTTSAEPPFLAERAFASVTLAAGRAPRWVMARLGHTDARLTLNVHAQVMQRQRVDEALIWQLMRFPDEPEERSSGPTSRQPRGSAFGVA